MYFGSIQTKQLAYITVCASLQILWDDQKAQKALMKTIVTALFRI